MLKNPDPKFQNSKFLKFVTQLNNGELKIEGNDIVRTGFGESAEAFDAVRAKQAAAGTTPSVEELINVIKEGLPEGGEYDQGMFDGVMAQQRAYGESASTFDSVVAEQRARDPSFMTPPAAVGGYEETAAHFDSMMGEGGHFSEESMAEMQRRAAEQMGFGDFDSIWNGMGHTELEPAEYEFMPDNPFEAMGGSMAMAEGEALFDAGDLAGAKLAFERAVSAEPGNSEGWRRLGQCHADSDDDVKAIMCLRKAVEADAGNLKALLGLGVSYTNELENNRALDHLKQWVEKNPRYASLAAASTGALTHESIVDMYLQASQMAPDDAEPRVVLGVLYNLSREYDKAIDCFQAALEITPEDYSLWNKLGATQANSSQSEASLEAYHKALETRPNYVRAWINVGMSFVNQGKYEEACKYYLRGLNLNQDAVHVWNYLRTALSLMGRMDLVGKCEAQDLPAFKAEFGIQDA